MTLHPIYARIQPGTRHSLALSLTFSLSLSLSLPLHLSVIHILFPLPLPTSPSPLILSRYLLQQAGEGNRVETHHGISGYSRGCFGLLAPRGQGAFSASVTIVSSFCNKPDRRK